MDDFVAEWREIKATLESQMTHFYSEPAGGRLPAWKYRERVGRMINQLNQLLKAHDA